MKYLLVMRVSFYLDMLFDSIYCDTLVKSTSVDFPDVPRFFVLHPN